MLTAKIKVAGKEYGVAWCFGTEVNYEIITGKQISTIDWSKLRLDQLATIIVAASYAYYDEQGNEEARLQDRDLLYHASGEEVVEATKTVLGLYTKFNTLPAQDKEADKEESDAPSGQEGDKPKD